MSAKKELRNVQVRKRLSVNGAKRFTSNLDDSLSSSPNSSFTTRNLDNFAEENSQLLGDSNNRNESEKDRDLLDSLQLDLLYVPKNCPEQVEQFAKHVWETGWKALPKHCLPHWLKDNDYIIKGYRPPLPSIRACFASIFRMHNETVNIWTHGLGALFFIFICAIFLYKPHININYEEKFIFGVFFFGAILCLLCSTLFHTFHCHSPEVSKFFNKIDYCGISILIVASFVPWLYYAFYCESVTKLVYLFSMIICGLACIVISLWDKFSKPEFRSMRAIMFIALGGFGIIPAVHYMFTVGFNKAFGAGAMSWLIAMAVLYITGASFYAVRIPERLFPGRFDIWFQSHSIFHCFVVAGAYVHYLGITKLASYRLTIGDCLTAHTNTDFSFEF